MNFNILELYTNGVCITCSLAQQEEQKQKLDEALHEVSKPLARYRDDEDLDAMLKAQDREGDPMLAFIKKKKIKDARKGNFLFAYKIHSFALTLYMNISAFNTFR